MATAAERRAAEAARIKAENEARKQRVAQSRAATPAPAPSPAPAPAPTPVQVVSQPAAPAPSGALTRTEEAIFGMTETQVVQAAALAQAVAQAVVQSPVVISTPEDTAPKASEVKSVTEQIAASVAPIIAPELPPSAVQDIVSSVVQNVVASPEIKATPKNVPVAPEITQQIIQSISAEVVPLQEEIISTPVVASAPVQAQAQPVVQAPATVAATPAPVKTSAPDANDLATLRYQAMQAAVEAGKQIAPSATPVTATPAPAAKAPTLAEQQATKAAEAVAVSQISGGQRTVTRTDRYGRTVEVIADGPMAGTIFGTDGILFEPPITEEPAPTETTPMAPKGIAGMTSTVSPTGQITLTPAPPPEPTGPTLARNEFLRLLGQFFPESDMNAAWMNALYDVVSGYYKSGVPIAESLNLSLREARTNPKLKPFADRFKGIFAIEDLKAAGRPVIVPTIAEYVKSEAQVADLLTQANLGDMANTDGIAQVLGKGLSVSQVGDRINRVFSRIDLAPQAIKDTLGRYFPTVDRNTLARTLLLGERGTQQLVDELAGLEVLAAAEQQGIGALGASPRAGGVTRERAQEFARAGITYGTALPAFARVRQAAPVEQKLSGISRRQSIGQTGVEQALVLGRAGELEQLEDLSEEERARFQARSGAMQPGLASQRRANRAF